MDWLDLLEVQAILKSLLQYHSSKASILWRSAFFIVQHSHPYMTTGKTKALTRWTFVGKVMSLLFNMLSRLVITFLPRNKQKTKSFTISIVSLSICHEVMGPDTMILAFWMLSFKPVFSLSSFTYIRRFFSSSSLSAIRVVSSAFLRLLVFLLATLVSACASSGPYLEILNILSIPRLCHRDPMMRQTQICLWKSRDGTPFIPNSGKQLPTVFQRR